MRSKIKLSVVFSFFNEENVLPTLIQRTRKAIENTPAVEAYELIFVNDSSTDDSEKILLTEIQKSNDIMLLNMSRNFGVSECVYAGMNYASGDAVIYMDADLQDPPELIPMMVAAFVEDNTIDVVYTTRRSRAGENAIKMLITKIGYTLINFSANINIPVDSGDFKLISRRVKDILIKHEEKLPYVRGLISYYGFQQKQIFYDRDPRLDGAENTKFPVLTKRVIYNALDSAVISFSDAPLKLALFIGFGVAILAALYLLVVLIQKFFGFHVPGWPALMSVILILGASQLIVLGFMGLYIKSIFLEVKKRPNYIIDKVVTSSDTLSVGALDSGDNEKVNADHQK